MKTLFLVIATCLSFSVNAQTSVYYSFPDSNAVWTIQAQRCCVSNCPSPPTPNPVLDDYNFSYFLQGDTSIGSVAYHKLYKSGSIHSHCAFGNAVDYWSVINTTYVGGLRQDTALKQVYIYHDTATAECLLYDFSLSVGDTLVDGCAGIPSCATVTSIDSVMIGSTYRKRFNLSSMGYAIIEGIGSTAGLLEPLCPFEYFGMLVCFSQNGQTLYPDTTTVCEILTKVDEINAAAPYFLSPNPFSTSTTLQVGSEFVHSQLFIYNTLGNTVRQQTIQESKVVILRNELSSGIYFFKVVNDKRKTVCGKLIIE